ncbi:hypothetical protein FIBSPDRAFT_966132 [Athelia psychrophila]|uniref:Uncharacterized protein n=1 Tax=Athelia psychrophila TaxID=1759441 RepID=A0A167X547_9AGAM|nr:hypothetical protein FIBSPDRAFT_966132 [Fibularhizoctonia sp. CBS 109695]
MASPADKALRLRVHNHLCGPANGTLSTIHHNRTRDGKHISLPAFARALQAGYTLYALLAGLFSFSSFSSSCRRQISRGMMGSSTGSLLDMTTLKEELTPSEVDEDLLKVCVRRANESPVLDGIRAEIARGEVVVALRTFAGPASSSSSVLGCRFFF